MQKFVYYMMQGRKSPDFKYELVWKSSELKILMPSEGRLEKFVDKNDEK